MTSEPGWDLDGLAGRLVEISGSAPTATLTTAASLIAEAQRRGEPAAWVSARGSSFYPPDFADAGIDLDALPVVRASDATGAWRATDLLLRSGGFAIVVLDVAHGAALPFSVQTRLAGLARRHHTVLLCVTRKGEGVPSLGSLVSIRAEVEKRRADFDRFACELRVVKDKRHGPGATIRELYGGPSGLC